MKMRNQMHKGSIKERKSNQERNRLLTRKNDQKEKERKQLGRKGQNLNKIKKVSV